MLEFPLIQDLLAEKTQKIIVRFLRTRFKSVPEEMVSAVQTVREEAKLDTLVDLAASCPDLEAFRRQIEALQNITESISTS